MNENHRIQNLALQVEEIASRQRALLIVVICCTVVALLGSAGAVVFVSRRLAVPPRPEIRATEDTAQAATAATHSDRVLSLSPTHFGKPSLYDWKLTMKEDAIHGTILVASQKGQGTGIGNVLGLVIRRSGDDPIEMYIAQDYDICKVSEKFPLYARVDNERPMEIAASHGSGESLFIPGSYRAQLLSQMVKGSTLLLRVPTETNGSVDVLLNLQGLSSLMDGQ